MKKAFAIVLSIILLIPSLGTLVVFTSFKINQAEISKTICEQKANINNSCNGRCELQKSLKQLEDNEKEMSNHLKEKSELVFILHTFESFHLYTSFIATEKNFKHFVTKTKTVTAQNFHPPTRFI